MDKCRLWLFAGGVLLLPLLLPALATAWLAWQPSADANASRYVVVHFGPLWLLAGLGLACIPYTVFGGKRP